MTIRKGCCCVLGALLVLLGLTGCTEPPLTAEQVLENLNAAMEAQPEVQYTMALELEMRLGADGIAMNFDLKTEGTQAISDTTERQYACMTSTTKVMGEVTETVHETFIHQQDGERHCYDHEQTSDLWSYQTLPPEEDDAPLSYETLTMPEETELQGGREVYVLTMTLTGSDVMTLLGDSLTTVAEDPEAGSPLDDALELDERDLKDVTATLRVHVDAETFLPQAMMLEVEGFSLNRQAQMTPITGNAEVQAAMAELRFKTFTMECRDFVFESVTIPEPPEDVDALVEASEAKKALGTLVTLTQGADSVTLTAPTGWAVTEGDGTFAMMVEPSGLQTATAMLMADLPAEAAADYVKDTMLNALADMGYAPKYDRGEPMAAFETLWIRVEGQSFCYAWMPVGESLLMIEVVDTTEGELQTVLKPFIESVKANEV